MSTFGGWWDPVWNVDPFEQMRQMIEEANREFFETGDWQNRGLGRRAIEGGEGRGGAGSTALTGPQQAGAVAGFQPYRHRRNPIRMDLIESPDSVTVIAEMPGFNKEDIRVHCDENNLLEIEAERKEERIPQPGEVMPRREVQYGFFRRAVRLPGYADPKNVQSEYKNGMLGIKFGRRPVPGVQQIAIK